MYTKQVAVFSDIHGNALALQAALDSIEQRHVLPDAIWCLGDILGRGPQPIETMEKIFPVFHQQSEANQRAWLKGNHDMLITGETSTSLIGDVGESGLVKDVLAVAEQHIEALNQVDQGKEYTAWLKSLKTHQDMGGGLYLAHGAYYLDQDGQVKDKESYMSYLTNPVMMRDQVNGITRNNLPVSLILSGHTHNTHLALFDKRTPTIITPKDIAADDYVFTVPDLVKTPLYVNVGSIGFPRQKKLKGTDIEVGSTYSNYILLELGYDDDTESVLRSVRVALCFVDYDPSPYIHRVSGMGLAAYDNYPSGIRQQFESHGQVAL